MPINLETASLNEMRTDLLTSLPRFDRDRLHDRVKEVLEECFERGYTAGRTREPCEARIKGNLNAHQSGRGLALSVARVLAVAFALLLEFILCTLATRALLFLWSA